MTTWRASFGLRVTLILGSALPFGCSTSKEPSPSSTGNEEAAPVLEEAPRQEPELGLDSVQRAGEVDVPRDVDEDASLIRYPDVLGVEIQESSRGVFRFSVTLSSPYDTRERYADAWRILAPDGTQLGLRVLTHDHAYEQPFTRSLAGVSIPEGIHRVRVQGRDKKFGFGGKSLEVDVPGR